MARLSTATFELHFTYDEEVGGAIGPAWLLQQKIICPDMAISAGFSYGVTTAHNGCLHLEVEVVGRSGHAAEPEKGIDALEAASGMLNDLYALRKRYAAVKSKTRGIGSPTLVIGLIRGGTNTNVVPDNVTFRLDRRIIPEEDPQAVEANADARAARIRSEMARDRRQHRAVLMAPPMVPIAGQEKLVAALAPSRQGDHRSRVR
jgi:acetylornithine deacetylase/succinyl-diaminopimelate desuccinylase-like protein